MKGIILALALTMPAALAVLLLDIPISPIMPPATLQPESLLPQVPRSEDGMNCVLILIGYDNIGWGCIEVKPSPNQGSE